MRVLLVTMYFPPAGGGGVARALKLAEHLPELGIETHVLAPDDSKWVHRDDETALPPRARVHRARYLGPRARRPAEELHGLTGLDRAARSALLFYRRLLLPDEFVGWALTAIPAAIRIVRSERIDVVVTTSPPMTVNLIGAAVKRATGVRWVADLRDSIAAKPDRRVERLAVRVKERGLTLVARLVARRADAVVAVTETIAEEARQLGAPRPFLAALAESKLDVVARFVGGLPAADREWAEGLGLGDRLEVLPYVPRRRALELQRDSEALLLLLPEAGGRGRTVPSGKIFEYLAAERPILAAVPTDGAAARLIHETGAGVVVAPEDVAGIREALAGLERRWRAGALNGTPLAPEQRDRLSRRARTAELAELLRSLV